MDTILFDWEKEVKENINIIRDIMKKERKNNIKNELLYASVWLNKMWFFPLLMFKIWRRAYLKITNLKNVQKEKLKIS